MGDELRPGMKGLRINKFFTEHGVCSRRAADRLIEEGRVSINGRTAILGDQVADGDVVSVDGLFRSNVPMSRGVDMFMYTFARPGEYSYLCSFHPAMTGKIIVK